MNNAPTLPASRGSLPPEGALRLRPGEAGSAAPAGGEGETPLAIPALLPLPLGEGRGEGLPESECVPEPAPLQAEIVLRASGLTKRFT
ncbi:MAG: lipoprotein releasing system, ATP-binding protein, partial [Polaromonas sp.]|nr:lipoprotein releasing system, ATP-binding protein [Polaromonas sp.]